MRGTALAVLRPLRARRQPVNLRRPARMVGTFAIVTGLVAAVALPAYAAWQPTEQTQTLQQVAQNSAQSMVVTSKAGAAAIQRDSYSATTPDEIATSKAQAAAAARAKQQQSVASVINLNLVGPGTGAIRWPLAHINHIGEGFGARGGRHKGIDLIADGGSPIFAATSGVVRLSTESYSTYGVCVMIDTVINGIKVTTLYAHMRYGSRMVTEGQTVTVGQPLGLVGMTGLATANHLHFEVHYNDVPVDPLAWLYANAG